MTQAIKGLRVKELKKIIKKIKLTLISEIIKIIIGQMTIEKVRISKIYLILALIKAKRFQMLC
jgi:hypothetical protein